MTTWHYLPVYVEHGGSIEFSICEVHLDDEGVLTAWTSSRSVAPSGESAEELRGDLEHMMNDVTRWRPVNFSDLVVGMRLLPTSSNSSA